MTVSVKIHKGQLPTEEQCREIKEAAKRTPVFDEEAPELSMEQMERYRRAAIDKRQNTTVTLELSREDMDKARSFGTGYRDILGRLLKLAMNDSDMIKKAQL